MTERSRGSGAEPKWELVWIAPFLYNNTTEIPRYQPRLGYLGLGYKVQWCRNPYENMLKSRMDLAHIPFCSVWLGGCAVFCSSKALPGSRSSIGVVHQVAQKVEQELLESIKGRKLVVIRKIEQHDHKVVLCASYPCYSPEHRMLRFHWSMEEYPALQGKTFIHCYD